MMSIILAGAAWYVLLPSAADLCGLVGLQQGLLALQVCVCMCVCVCVRACTCACVCACVCMCVLGVHMCALV